jgi:hypothetical protein
MLAPGDAGRCITECSRRSPEGRPGPLRPGARGLARGQSSAQPIPPAPFCASGRRGSDDPLWDQRWTSPPIAEPIDSGAEPIPSGAICMGVERQADVTPRSFWSPRWDSEGAGPGSRLTMPGSMACASEPFRAHSCALRSCSLPGEMSQGAVTALLWAQACSSLPCPSASRESQGSRWGRVF